jgi:peptidoglycan-associated lipoprotein
MRFRIKSQFALLLALAAVSTRPTVAQTPGAQPEPAGDKPFRAELAVGYSYMHSNVPPGGCGCFNLNGGNATFAWPVKPGSFALVGDIAITHAGTVSSTGDSLTLSTFTAGGRYLPKLGHSPLQPFGQALIGLAHSSGTLVEETNPGVGNADAAFASNFGAGLDLRANPRFFIRLVEADYLLTTFDNGSNNHQNNLRISTGLVLHFGGK